MKSGWQTSEFWISLISQILGFLALIGVVEFSAVGTLEEALTKMIGAVFILLANGWIVVRYIQARTGLKQEPPRGIGPGVLPALFAALALGALAGPVSAQCPCPSCWPRSQPNGGDAELKALLRELITLMQQRQSQPPIIVLGGPYQQLPIAGAPRQELPIPGTPRQEVPVPGAPRQEVPIQGMPRQEVPPAGEPRQVLPGDTKPSAGPTTLARPPVGYQRYSSDR